MDLPNVKDLGKVIDLCRKKGVKIFQLGELRLELGDEPIRHTSDDKPEHNPADPYANFPQGDLSPTQLMFYSAGGLPENDPELKE